MLTSVYLWSTTFLSIETQVKEKGGADPLDPARPVSCKKTCDLYEDVEEDEEEEAGLPYIEQFEKEVQDEIILLGNSPLQEVRVKYQYKLTFLFCFRNDCIIS